MTNVYVIVHVLQDCKAWNRAGRAARTSIVETPGNLICMGGLT